MNILMNTLMLEYELFRGCSEILELLTWKFWSNSLPLACDSQTETLESEESSKINALPRLDWRIVWLKMSKSGLIVYIVWEGAQTIAFQMQTALLPTGRTMCTTSLWVIISDLSRTGVHM